MKKTFLLILAVVAMSGFANAQSLKIGWVDSHEIINAMPELAEAQKTLQDYAKELEEAMGSMQNEFKTKYADYQSKYETLSPVLKKSREEELAGLQERIESFRQTAQQDLQKREMELQEPIISKVQNAIDAVGRENDFTYIFDATPGNGILYKSANAQSVNVLVKRKLGLE